MNIDKFLDYIGWTFLIATLILLRVAERLLDNVIKAKSFLIEYSIYGLLISTTVLFLIYKLNPDYFRSGETKRGSAVLSYFFGVIALFVFLTAYINIETSKQNIRTANAFVKDHYENYRYKTKYVLLDFDGRTERFQPKKEEWDKISVNDTITLTIGQGQLGYENILQFTKNTGTTTDEKNGSH
jgi:hypothetical protein